MDNDNIKNLKKREDEYVGEIYFPLFKKNIEVILYDENIEYAKKCVNYLQNIDKKVIDDFCESSLNYFYDDLELIGKNNFDVDMPLNIKGEEILNYIYPQTLIIPKEENNDIAFELISKTKWDINELSWMVRNGKTVYLGENYGKEQSIKMEEYLKTVDWNFSNLYGKSKKYNIPKNNNIPNHNEKNTENGKVKKNKLLIGIETAIITILFLLPVVMILVNTINYFQFKKNPSTYSTKIIDKKCSEDTEYGTTCHAILEYEVNNKKYKTKIERIPDEDSILIYYDSNNPANYYIENYDFYSEIGLLCGALAAIIIVFIIIGIKKIISSKRRKL